MLRSEIHFADYNPRYISPENLKTLRKGIKKFGLVGGIVVNRQTGNTLVQGHQRLTVMDELQKYDSETQENDYRVRADVIDIDEKSEKELVILLNNPNAQGEWDNEKLKALVPDIDYSAAGLTDADLAIIGYGIEQSIAAVSAGLASQPVPLAADIYSRPTSTNNADSGGDSTASAGEPIGANGEQTAIEGEGTEIDPDAAERERQAKIQHMKDVKAQANAQAMERAEQNVSYLMLSFDNLDNMIDFLDRFGFPERTQIIKGEEFLTMLEEQE